MRKMLCILAALTAALLLTACDGGDVKNVEVIPWEASEIYSDKDIYAAIDGVKAYFQRGFSGCTMTSIGYVGDDAQERFEELAQKHDADEGIILYSSFDVAEPDGPLEPNSTYNNWKWYLVRDKGGRWKHVDHGYA